MKIIKEYQTLKMKHVQYDSADADILKTRFRELKPETIDKLCLWLAKNNAVIDARDCYDAQSGWQGTNFNIGNANLSCNGYNLNDSNVELFLNGGKDPMWYNSFSPEFEAAKKWKAANGYAIE